jgi:oxaloacetate decarboxylase gamma subunit
METNLVLEGTKFMFLGMAAVLLFLFVMILVTKFVSKRTDKFFPEPETILSEDTYTKTYFENKSEQDKRRIVAAITAAIMFHRSKQGNKKVIAAISAAIMHHTQG